MRVTCVHTIAATVRARSRVRRGRGPRSAGDISLSVPLIREHSWSVPAPKGYSRDRMIGGYGSPSSLSSSFETRGVRLSSERKLEISSSRNGKLCVRASAMSDVTRENSSGKQLISESRISFDNAFFDTQSPITRILLALDKCTRDLCRCDKRTVVRIMITMI